MSARKIAGFSLIVVAFAGLFAEIEYLWTDNPHVWSLSQWLWNAPILALRIALLLPPIFLLIVGFQVWLRNKAAESD